MKKIMHIRIYKPKDIDCYLVFWGTTKKNLALHYKKFLMYKYAAMHRDKLIKRYKPHYEINYKFIR